MSQTYFHEMMRGVLLLSHAMVERGDGKYYKLNNKKVIMKLPTGVLYWIKEPNYKSDLSANNLFHADEIPLLIAGNAIAPPTPNPAPIEAANATSV